MRKILKPEAEIPLDGFEAFYDEFLTNRKEELIILKEALAAGNFKILVEYGHKWKGFCSPYGFQELSELSILMEQSALKADAQGCQAILVRIDEYLGDDS